MSTAEISGVCPIIATPFTENGDVDYDSLRNQVRTMADGGCHGATLFGLASEFYKLTDLEKREMTDVVTDELANRDVNTIITVTHQSTEIAVENAKYADEAGADCIMVLPPFMRDVTKRGIYEHVAAIGEAVSIPVMVQYAPSKTGVTIQPETFINLNQSVENVQYFKIECQPPGPYISQLEEKAGEDAHTLVGHAGFQMIEAFDRGAKGVMPAASLFEQYLEVYDEYSQGNRNEAIKEHNKLLPILNHTIQLGVVYEKRILSNRGIIATDYCREPVVESDEYYQELFEDYFAELKTEIE